MNSGGYQRHFVDEDGGSYLVSISDLMAGLIFLFIITLMVFALSFGRAVQRRASLQDTRNELLRVLGDELIKKGITVEVVEGEGVLRLTEKSIKFRSGQDILDSGSESASNVALLAGILREVLPCFVQSSKLACKREIDRQKYPANVEALFVEGHTDKTPVGKRSRFQDNYELSGLRASDVVRRMLEATENQLDELRNSSGLKILSLSGYADQRPANRENPYADENRRIDLRFIMEPPPDRAATLPTAAREVKSELEHDAGH
ncbi:MAG: hypothetical protein KDH09_07930 [Chrysiogenetes bacterium]|nr:hypothetical protein [Chrysiogenetes bacterium]